MSVGPRLPTARTLIRLGRVDEAPLLLAYRLANREHLAPWEPQREPAYWTEAHCRQSLLDGLLAARDERGYPLLVFDPTQTRLLASCTLGNVVRGVFQACHLGYGIAADRQGQGLMQEVLPAVLDFAFGPLALHRVMANYMPHNQRSGRLLQRLGFQREGYASRYLNIAGQWQDHVLTALIAEDWQARRAAVS